jgi:hypothetical protein
MGHPRLTRVRAKAKSRSKAAGGGFLPSLTGLGSPFSGLPRTYVLDYCLPPLRGWFRISSFYPRLAPWAAFCRRFAAGVGQGPLRGAEAPLFHGGVGLRYA